MFRIQRKMNMKFYRKLGEFEKYPILLAWLVLAGAGCDMNFGRKKVIEPPKPAPVQTAEAQNPSEGEILARVNGQPVYMAPLHEALVADYGLPLAQQLVADEVVRQELVRRKLPVNVSAEEVAQENDRMLRTIFDFNSTQSPQQMETLLTQFLAKRQNTRRQWDATMARNVRLTRIAAGQIKATDAEVLEEFYRQYDGKLRVRHIQVPSLVEAEKVLRELGKGNDFAETAYKFSTSPSAKTGAWLPDIGTREASPKIPPALAKAAQSLKKPGDQSNPIQVGTNFHILRLEEIIPPKDVKFEDVKKEMKSSVEYRLIMQKRHEILQGLLNPSRTKIEYVNPTIQSQSTQR